MLFLWNFFLERRQLSYVLICVLIIAGTYALLKIPKENAPSLDIPIAIVTATLPGASAEDIETLVTNKLESQISGISNIDTLTSNSSDGLSQITVQFTASADTDRSIQDLRDAVSRALPNLPTDVTAPQVTKLNFNDRPIVVVSIAGDLTPMQFSELGRSLSDELLAVSGVSQVSVAGVPKREVDVIVRKEALDQYGWKITDVISAISTSNPAATAGRLSIDGIRYHVNFKGDISDPEQVRDIAISSKNGVPIYLRDIADISDALAPITTYSRLSLGGEPAKQGIALQVYKQSSAGIQKVATAVRAKVDSLRSSELQGLDVFVPPSTDQGTQVTKQLGNLSQTGLITVALVIVVLFFTIGWRESIVAALSIPLSFLISFIGLYVTGNTLNFISLFALILAVGILVDSGIVVTEAIHARLRTHGGPMPAARAALKDYAWPLIAGTMATVAVFAPLFFISGIVGKFIAGIPYTLIFVLVASILVALGIVPLIAVLFTAKGAPNRLEQKLEHYTTTTTRWYTTTLHTFLQNDLFQKRFRWGLIGMLILSLTLPMLGLIPVTFFPQSDEDFIYINIQKPQGTVLEQTDLSTRAVEELLYNDPDVASFQTTVGESSALSGQSSSGSNQANITVNLPEHRSKTSTEVQAQLQKRLAVLEGLDVQVLQANNGPSAGAPIQIQFEGDNLDDLITAAEKGRQLLSTLPDATNITASTEANGTAFDLTVDRAKAAALGLNAQQLGATLHAAISGTKATTINEPNQTIDVMVKLNLNPLYQDNSHTADATIDAVKNLSVQGSAGPVLLGSVVNNSLGISNAAIAHKDKKRVETVSAYPDARTTTSAVVSAFQKRVGELNLPAGVTVSYGGESESINESFTQMFVALIAGIVLMFLILIVSFDSIRYTLYLLSIVPLSLIGVLWGLALTGQSVSFTSLLGVIGLGGVIINHAIILMDSLITERREHPQKPLIDAVVDASKTRFRPIVLTTIATAIGMIPLAISDPTWGPFAITIMFGLLFAICLTLVLVPMLFYRALKRKEGQLT